MNKILKIAFLTSAITAPFLCASAALQDHKLDLGGFIHLKYAHTSQKSAFETETPGSKTEPKRVENTFFNQTELTFKYSNKAWDVNKLGVELTLFSDTTASPTGMESRGKRLRSYLETPYGKFEIGEIEGASILMQKSANSIAVGSGGIDGFFDYYENNLTIDGARKDSIFINYPYLPIGSDFAMRRAKVSYYTPEYKGWSFGVSYTPDINNSGTVSKNQTLTNVVKPKIGKDLVAYEDIFEGAANYTFDAYGIDNKLAATTQIGSSKAVNDGDPRENLRAYELGFVSTYDKYSIAASYGDWGKSGTSKVKKAGSKYDAYYYTLGAAYNDTKFGASITYMNSKRAGGSRVFSSNSGVETDVINESAYNKLRVISVGTDYKIAEGLKSYIEYTNFNYDRTDTKVDNKGGIYIFGVKLSF